MANKLHIDNWISKAQPDYYTMFIKAWIPFNAWYFSEYSTKKDSEALRKIQTTKNKIRNRIEALITNNTIESKNFKYNLAQLHIQLESRSIMNFDKLVSFNAINLDEHFPEPVTDRDKKGNVYKAIPNKSTGYRAIIVDKGDKSIMDKTFNPYSLDDFLIDSQYVALPSKWMQEKIKNCFSKINPDTPIKLISKSKVRSDYIILDSVSKVQFVNDSELIAKGIIQILYSLRCLLFHGELDPTETNICIYEHGFNLLNTIIKELK